MLKFVVNYYYTLPITEEIVELCEVSRLNEKKKFKWIKYKLKKKLKKVAYIDVEKLMCLMTVINYLHSPIYNSIWVNIIYQPE